MNESVFLQFTTAAGVWPLTAVSDATGVRFQESDPYDRDLQLQVWTDNPITELKLRDVRTKNDWDRDKFRFVAAVDNGSLHLKGVDANSLPSGDYKLRITIEGTTAPKDALAFTVHPNGAARVTVPLTPDPRQVRLALGHDPRIDRLLDVPATVEGLSLRAWLDSGARPMRKACALNLVAKLRSFPTADAPFIDLVNSVFAVKAERIYASVKPALKARLDALSVGPGAIVELEGAPVDAAVHRQLLDQLPVPSDAARANDYTLVSYRADGEPSLQSVVGVPPDGSHGGWYCDFDLDLGDSLEDVKGFVIHMGELVGGTMTDHLALHDELAQGDTRPFLYYSVVNA